MDSNPVVPSLQKTSPSADPAALFQLTNVSTQASVLATQQQQLNQLTSLTEELVNMLQHHLLPAPVPSTPPVSSAANPALSSTVTTNPWLAAYWERFGLGYSSVEQ